MFGIHFVEYNEYVVLRRGNSFKAVSGPVRFFGPRFKEVFRGPISGGVTDIGIDVQTKDFVDAHIRIRVLWKPVFKPLIPAKMFEFVHNAKSQWYYLIFDALKSHLLSFVSKIGWQELSSASERNHIEEFLERRIKEFLWDYGVYITSIRLGTIKLPPTIEKAILDAQRAKLFKDAGIQMPSPYGYGGNLYSPLDHSDPNPRFFDIEEDDNR